MSRRAAWQGSAGREVAVRVLLVWKAEVGVRVPCLLALGQDLPEIQGVAARTSTALGRVPSTRRPPALTSESPRPIFGVGCAGDQTQSRAYTEHVFCLCTISWGQVTLLVGKAGETIQEADPMSSGRVSLPYYGGGRNRGSRRGRGEQSGDELGAHFSKV